MLRAFLTFVFVIAISICIAHLRDAQGQRSAAADATKIAWVRTVDGWEQRNTLHLRPRRPQGPPALHPGLVASLQVGVSLFALLALPTTNRSALKS